MEVRPHPGYKRSMAFDDPRQRTILTHAVLVGLSQLIPIPFVDDLVQSDLERRLIRSLADLHGLSLTEGDIEVLANEDRAPWLSRTAKGMVLYPVKKIFRKTFFLLGLKNMVDLVARSWHRGFLFDHAFAEHYCAPKGTHNPVAVRAAVDAVCEEVPTTPVKPVLRLAFEQSMAGLRRVGEHLTRSLLRRAGITSVEEADPIVEEVQTGEQGELDSIVGRIMRGLSVVPEEHFQRLRGALDRRLGRKAPVQEVVGAA